MFLKKERKVEFKSTAQFLNMKHDVTASVNVYLCFINNIKRYPSCI